MNKLQFIKEAKKLLNRAKEEILLFKEDFSTAVDELLEIYPEELCNAAESVETAAQSTLHTTTINQVELKETETEEQINKR